MLRYSTGLRNKVAGGSGWRTALANGRLEIYSGAQPSDADQAPTGTKLCTFTVDGSAFSGETRASGTIQVVSGGSGSIDTVTVGGFPLIGSAVAWNTDVNTTASDLCDAINAYNNIPDFTATVVGDTVTIHAPWSTGTTANGIAIATTKTTIATADDATLAGGVDAANGLSFSAPVAGVISKAAGVWQADPVATGTAGWFRYVASDDDDGSLSTEFARFDGTIATANGDINLASTSIQLGTPQTINSFSFTIPAYSA